MSSASKTNIKTTIDVDLQSSEWNDKLDIIKKLSYKISDIVFNTVNLKQYVKHAEFCIVLTNDAKIQQLNKDFRGKDKATNVLSFPAEEIKPNNLEEIKTYRGFLMIGDIAFSWETLINEAKNQGKSFESHFCHLLTHSLLHLLGYDHVTDEDANNMENLEVEILSKLDIKSPY